MIKSYLDFINENFSSPVLEPSNQRSVTFTKKAWEQYNDWGLNDRKMQKLVKKTIDLTMRDPFMGSHCKKLAHDKFDTNRRCSKQIDFSNRLVYEVLDKEIKIYSCMGHYDDK